ncbi:MAG: hypothetical protein JWO08_3092 [Verrucomicrobiaceae bacterium]|nr:hypothetical protein [Verrucomicrobiaceae bacterium]
MIEKQRLLDMARRSPGIRTMQLCDQLDEDIESVEIALQREINAGTIDKHDVIAPNGRKAVAFTLAGVSLPTAGQAGAPVAPVAPAEPIIAVLKDAAKAAKPPGYVDRAVAFIRTQPNLRVPNVKMHVALGLKQGQAPISFLQGGLSVGRLIKEGPDWLLGPKEGGTGKEVLDTEKPSVETVIVSSVSASAPTVPAPTVIEKSVTTEPDASVFGRIIQQVLCDMFSAPHDPRGKKEATEWDAAQVPAEPREIPTFVPPKVDMVPVDQPHSEFQCALWSNGELQLVRDDTTVLKLSAVETRQIREYLSRVKGPAVPA